MISTLLIGCLVFFHPKPIIRRRDIILGMSYSSFGIPLLAEANNDVAKMAINQKNKAIYFSGDITEETCFALFNSIKTFEYLKQDNSSHIDLYIQSRGGSLLPSLGLADIIKSANVPIYTYVNGYAASAGTILSVVGSKRFMTKNSVMLLHQLKMGIEPSKYNEIIDQYENSKLLMDIIKDIYLSNSKITEENLNKILARDLWLNSSMCLELGLVDEII